MINISVEVWRDTYRKYWVASVYDEEHNELYYEEYHYKKDAIMAADRLLHEGGF